MRLNISKLKSGGNLPVDIYIPESIRKIIKSQSGSSLTTDEKGALENTGSSVVGKSGIHIKKKNIGKFTATKKATGKSTEELTHSKNSLTRKRAVFAQNAKKWKHQEGGIFKPQVDTTGFYNQAVQLNNKYKNLNWISRQNNTTGKNELQYKFRPEDNQEGSYGTMLTSYSTNTKGNQIAFPQIQQLPNQNKLTYFSNWKDALNSATKNKETINMGKDPNFAEYYTTIGTKLKQQPQVLQQAKEDYSRNTNIKPISVKPTLQNNFKMF